MGIAIEDLTKTFPNGRGIFHLTFEVREGEVFGYLGPNGAGKSTTIRHLLGFVKPDQGHALIDGQDCWKDAASIQQKTGYLPGEISFPEGMNGLQFLELLSGMRRMKNVTRRNHLIERLQFDVKTPIRKMSKGMKQKIGIVAAFMHDPHILILDEPTSGLDPLMQNTFIELVLEEKARGKTILMSSHSFAEIDRSCDRAGMIKDGHLVAVEEVRQLQTLQRKIFDVTVQSEEDVQLIRRSGLEIVQKKQFRLQIAVQGNVEHFIKVLSQCRIDQLDIHTQNLEDVFMHFYHREGSAL